VNKTQISGTRIPKETVGGYATHAQGTQVTTDQNVPNMLITERRDNGYIIN